MSIRLTQFISLCNGLVCFSREISFYLLRTCMTFFLGVCIWVFVLSDGSVSCPAATQIPILTLLSNDLLNSLMMPFYMQRDHSRKRLESHHFDSSGNIGEALFLSLGFSNMYLVVSSSLFIYLFFYVFF